jgi:Putative DNA-binding domain
VNSAEIVDRLRRQEDRNFDFKVGSEFSGEFRAALTVDIAAMANTPSGGTLVVGVRKVDGIWVIEGCTASQLASFDKTRVAQSVRNFLDPLPRFEIEIPEVEGKKLVAVAIAEFEDVPIVVKKTIQHGEKLLAREGDLLIRSEAAESRPVQSADEFRQLLGRAISRKSEALLADIRAVVTGAGPRRLEETPNETFEAQLPSWPGEVAAFDDRFSRYARWEVRILPLPLSGPLDPKLLPMLLRSASVSYRGWDFPHIDRLLFGLGHVEMRTDSQEFKEVGLFGERGPFGFSTVIWSELTGEQKGFEHPEPPDRLLEAIGVLWSITEFFRFALNLAESLKSENVWLSVRLKGIRRRSLGSFDPRRRLSGDRQSRIEEVPLAELLAVADLKSAWKEKARDWAKRIFTVFQWPEADDAMLSKDQDQLIERRW